MEVVKRGLSFMPKIRLSIRKIIYVLTAVTILTVIATYNYLLFHTLAEGLNIILAALIYVLAVKTFRYSKNNPLFFLGYSYLFMGIFYSLHLLWEMNFFPDVKNNALLAGAHPGYFVQAVTFLVVPFFIKRHFPKRLIFGVYSVAVLFMVGNALAGQGTIFNCNWATIWDGPFMVQLRWYGRWTAILVFGAAGYHLYRKQKQLNPQIYSNLQAAIFFAVIAGVCDLPAAGRQFFNIAGHIARIIMNLWIYRLIVTFGIEAPYDLIFKELRNNVILDPLTGIYNRNGLVEFIKKELGRVRRADSLIGILVMDLDNFKKVNDRYGHLTGDKVLKSFAAILKTTVRESDVICRFGGDEFVVLIKGDREVLELVRWRIREAFQSWQETDEMARKIGLSIGSALWESNEKINLEKLLEEADLSMYNEKIKKKTPKKQSESIQLTIFGN